MRTCLPLVFLVAMVTARAQVPVSPEDVSPLLVGEEMPQATISTIEGTAISTQSLWAGKKTILIFYRGSWCPYCNTHLAEVGRIEQPLLDLGYQLIAISPDAASNLQKAIDKNELKYQLYSDADMSFAKQVGIAFKAPERYNKRLVEDSDGKNLDLLLPVPSLFILDEKGIIQFEYINPNYKVRITSDLLMAVAKALATNTKN
ncbi:MAG: peroxiredoxin-like family protein [Cyclobacteriaceae bacterium]